MFTIIAKGIGFLKRAKQFGGIYNCRLNKPKIIMAV